MKLNSLSITTVFLTLLLFTSLSAQVSDNDRQMAIGMLDTTKAAIKKNYYDPAFRGIDVDFVFEQAKERMKVAPNRDALMITIASAVMTFDDSHTTFVPPPRAAEVEYGWQVMIVGDDAYIKRVKPGTDAEAKGVKPGDRLLAIDGFKPMRKNLWQMNYRYDMIAPTSKVNMTLLSPGDQKPRSVEVLTKIVKTGGVKSPQQWYDSLLIRRGALDSRSTHEWVESGTDLLVWKMRSFSTSPENIDKMMAKARNAKSLIIDLRDNGGGSVEILKRLVGYFFEKDVKIGDEKRRKETKEMIAKTRGGDVFKGNVTVLVNHASGSASELFARVIQLEKRGKVIGDTSAGAVMESIFHPMESGFGNSLYFGASITMADLIMVDGKSLEKVGVMPDEKVMPTGADLAAGLDPVLTYAAKQYGVAITPEKAGSLFPYEWPRP